MAFKMKGPSLYPNYRGTGKKTDRETTIPKEHTLVGINNEDTSTSDGRATSSPFQMKHKATATHFADGTKKSKRDLFNDKETANEEAKKTTLKVKKGSAADRKGKNKKTLKDYLNEGFSQVEAEQMFKSQATTGRVS
jgi:hypothetical protein